MRCPFTRLAVGLITFVVGVGLAAVWVARRAEPRVKQYVTLEYTVNIYGDDRTAPAAPPVDRAETAKERAARLAEEFVARNGYTDLPAERDDLSYEFIEPGGDVDDVLDYRRNTLERKAHDVFRGSTRDAAGWTVVFRYAPPYGRYGEGPGGGPPIEKRGRMVTMNKNFGGLRVEHQGIVLAKVKKKL